MPQLEAWQKVYIGGNGAQLFFGSLHGQMSCRTCHGGQSGILTMDSAHVGMVASPSPDSECSICHSAIVNNHTNSLHNSLGGYKSLFERRAGFSIDSDPSIRAHFDADCNKCHTTCGECHISRPRSVGGGFVQGHRFLSVPNMTENCTACHGSRIGMEYKGENAGLIGDVHYASLGYSCTRCHTADEMHGDGNQYTARYQMPAMPRCEDCHGGEANSNAYHQSHWGDLSCQVCHSQDYKNCNNCHAGAGGIQTPSYMNFKIGHNPIPGQRDYEYVVLRHIPIAENTFAAWGINSLSGYSSEPTWKYSSPHNIKRWTLRTQVNSGEPCFESCHETPNDTSGFFLRQADLDILSVNEAAANADLIVPDGPPTDSLGNPLWP